MIDLNGTLGQLLTAIYLGGLVVFSLLIHWSRRPGWAWGGLGSQVLAMTALCQDILLMALLVFYGVVMGFLFWMSQRGSASARGSQPEDLVGNRRHRRRVLLCLFVSALSLRLPVPKAGQELSSGGRLDPYLLVLAGFLLVMMLATCMRFMTPEDGSKVENKGL